LFDKLRDSFFSVSTVDDSPAVHHVKRSCMLFVQAVNEPRYVHFCIRREFETVSLFGQLQRHPTTSLCGV